MTCHGRLLASPYLHVTMFAVRSSPQGHPRLPAPHPTGDRGDPGWGSRPEGWRRDRCGGMDAALGAAQLLPRRGQRRWETGMSAAPGPAPTGAQAPALSLTPGCSWQHCQPGHKQALFIIIIIIFGRGWQYLARKVFSHCLPLGGAGEGLGPSRACAAPSRSQGGTGGDASKYFAIPPEGPPQRCLRLLPACRSLCCSLPPQCPLQAW